MIDEMYVINLDHRQDRMEKAQEQFSLHKMEVKRISAVDGRTGAYATEGCDTYNNACTLSHVKVLKDAKEKGHKIIMVFEDDVILQKYFQANLNDSWRDLPLGWDILYLGGTHRKQPLPVTQNLYRVQQTLTTHGYIIREHIYDELIEQMSKPMQPVDCYFAEIQKRNKCFITNPVLAWQRPGGSDIVHRTMDYRHLKSNQQ